MTKNLKQIIVVVVVIIISFIAFKVFFTSDSVETSITADSASTETLDGQFILSLLGKLNNLSLDESIFSDEVFISLQGFERELDSQVLTRKNPFLPIGVENSNSLAPRSTTTAR